MNSILIIDDNQQILRLLTISLQKADYSTITAKNGQEGYDAFINENPDLILSDIMMPDFNGFELCLKIREGEVNPLVPFIFMTSAESSDMEVKGFRAGADDFIQKPIERQELIDSITKLLNRQKKVGKIESKSAKTDIGLSGNLSDITLVEIIQLLSLNHRSGTLIVDGGKTGKANIYFNNGNMKRIEGAFGEGNEALKSLVAINKGTFSLEANKEFDENLINISGPTMSALMEACRLNDEEQQS